MSLAVGNTDAIAARGCPSCHAGATISCMSSRAQTWLYRALAAGVVLVLLLAVWSHLGQVRALIRGAASAPQVPWLEVCTPQGIQRVAMDDAF